jgi:hypothetical protein
VSLRAFRFLAANALSPVVYVGVDANCCTYRLSDGSTWRFSIRESREIGVPRFAHLEAA